MQTCLRGHFFRSCVCVIHFIRVLPVSSQRFLPNVYLNVPPLSLRHTPHIRMHFLYVPKSYLLITSVYFRRLSLLTSSHRGVLLLFRCKALCLQFDILLIKQYLIFIAFFTVTCNSPLAVNIAYVSIECSNTYVKFIRLSYEFFIVFVRLVKKFQCIVSFAEVKISNFFGDRSFRNNYPL